MYRKEFISRNGSNGRAFYASRDTLRKMNFYFTIRLASGNLCWYYTQSGSALLWAYVTSKFRRRSRKIESRQEAWREQTFLPAVLATFAINRARTSGVSSLFSRSRSRRSSPHFPAAVFLGCPAVLNEQITFSHGVYSRDQFTSATNRHGTVRVAEDCDRRRSAAPCAGIRREETVPPISHRWWTNYNWRAAICTPPRERWKRRETIGTPVESSIAPPLANARNCVNGIELPSIARTGNSRARFDLLDDCWWIPTEWLSFCG